MSNVLKRSLIKHALYFNLQNQSKRLFSVSRIYYDEEKPEIQFAHKGIDDIIADFGTPLPDVYDESDPRTILIRSIDKLKPKKDILSADKMKKLHSHVFNSYNVGQLRKIVSYHHLKTQGLKKDQLIASIIENIWHIKTPEQIKEEALKIQLDTVKKSFPAHRHELFFIIGDNGSTIRNIEQQNQVKVTIDVSNKQYIVEGLTAAVANARKEILSYLTIIEDKVDIPTFVCENPTLQTEIENSLADISNVAGTFIARDDNKFTLASLSKEALEDAKRLLSLMLAELNTSDKKGLHKTQVINNPTEPTLLPIYNSGSMSLYNGKLNWNRLQCKHSSENDFQTLEGQAVGSIEDIKDVLMKPFQNSDLESISLEARFGYLLFQNPSDSILVNSSIDRSAILDLCKNRSLFYPTMPPRQITPTTPLALDGGFHQRSVVLKYINKSILDNKHTEQQDINRMNVEFVIDEQGNMSLKHVVGIKQQSVVDLLNVYGNVDIRLLANETVDYSKNEELKGFLTDSCKLTSYSELNAPKMYAMNHQESNMILSDITFINKKRYLVESNLLCFQHIEQQDKRVKRTELKVESVDAETLNPRNAISRWSSFSNLLNNLAKKWEYSTARDTTNPKIKY